VAAQNLGPLTSAVYDAVLFDLDGTLVDSTASVGRVWHRWAAERGLDPAWTVPHGVPARQVLATLVPAEELEAALAQVSRLELEDDEDVRPLPGAVAALAALPAARTAIVTSGLRALATQRIRRAGLVVPPLLVAADDVRVGKPDPAPWLMAARLLGVDPARCLVVEDAPAGLQAGRAAGCATLAVTTTHPAHELEADAVVEHLGAVRFVAAGDGVRLRGNGRR